MTQTALTETGIVPGAKDILARVYEYFPSAGGFGFATQDADLPARGKRPKGANFIFRAENLERDVCMRHAVLVERGDVIMFDIRPQPFKYSLAIETENVRLVRR